MGAAQSYTSLFVRRARRDFLSLPNDVQDFLIIYQIQDKALLVLAVKVGHRREVYRRH